MNSAAEKNFRELIADRGVSFSDLVRLYQGRRMTRDEQVSADRALRRRVLIEGRATPQELQRFVEILGCSKDELEAALAETVRRPGGDARGRKKLGAAEISGLPETRGGTA